MQTTPLNKQCRYPRAEPAFEAELKACAGVIDANERLAKNPDNEAARAAVAAASHQLAEARTAYLQAVHADERERMTKSFPG